MTHNTLLGLGEVSELRDSGQLDHIIAALRTRAVGAWLQPDELDAASAFGYGAVAVARAYFCRLGVDGFFAEARKAERLTDAAFVMTANRLLRPWSKRRTVSEWLGEGVSLPDDVITRAPPLLGRARRRL